MSRFSQNDLVQVTREIEVTPGTVVGGARTRVYGTAPTWTPGGSSNASGINTGSGGIQGVRAALRYADAEIPSQLVFGLNDLEFEDTLRDEYRGSEHTVSANLTFDQTGTHEDGSAGPVITAAPGTFIDVYDDPDDFVGLMMEVSGAAVHADNKWPRVIKAVKADGSKIDVEPLYCSAVSGFRCALHDESSKAGVIRLGDWIRNQGIQNMRSVNFEFNFTDQPGGSFVVVKGCHGSGFKLSFTGKGLVEVSFMYVGMDYNDMATATVGVGSVIENDAVDNDVFSSGEDLAYFAIGAINTLSADNLTSFNMDGNGNASGIDDVAGSRFRPGVTVGDIDVTGSLKIYHEHTKAAILHALGRSGNKGPIDFKLVDPAGNFYWGILPSCLFEPNGPKPGAKGSRTDSSINYKTQLGAGGRRTFILQKFAAA